MSEHAGQGRSIQQRLKHELESYLVTFAYLAFFFVAMTTYRRLVLDEYQVGAFQYGFALVKALVLAKIILIGEAVHLGRRFEDGPLLYSVLWKTLVFGLLAAIVGVIERVVGALVHHHPVAEEFLLRGPQLYELLARTQLMFVSFLPFFAFREIGRVIGEGKLLELFLRRRP